MSNYPDNFRGTPYDRENDSDREQAERFQQCYKDILTGVIGACVKNGVCPDKADVAGLVQNIREFIGEAAYHHVNEGTEVLDSKEAQDIERTYEAILDSFKVKALDYSPFYRALAPVNPASLVASGKVGV